MSSTSMTSSALSCLLFGVTGGTFTTACCEILAFFWSLGAEGVGDTETEFLFGLFLVLVGSGEGVIFLLLALTLPNV